MKKVFVIACSLLLPFFLPAQITFKTIVPQEKIVVGSSFRVQYVIEGAQKLDGFKTKGFPKFRIVAGPDLYAGSAATVAGERPVKNIVLTLEAVRPGKFIIPGASAWLDEQKWTSNNVEVTIISKQEAKAKEQSEMKYSASDYYLQPGEDPYKKMKDNLFVRVQVDKRKCYTGEPILVTYKLYSCLQSRSDIIKNPGFYGFSVFDMINLADKVQSTETIHGKLFDVHTIRKLQLFPLRAGRFTIDPMEIRNSVEFSTSLVNKKTEQKIIEGLYGQQPARPQANAVYYENEIQTPAVTINVLPLPAANKPTGFNGAVGKFYMASLVEKKNLAKGEQGFLKVMISGAGNFIQLTAPSVQWPEGVEAFSPTIEDHFEKTTTPLSGSRIFIFPFLATEKGTLNLPSLKLVYFDIDSNHFQTIGTPGIPVTINHKLQSPKVLTTDAPSIETINKKSGFMAAIIIALLAIGILMYWLLRKKEKQAATKNETILTPGVNEILQPVVEQIQQPGREFSAILYRVVWQYLSGKFQLEGTGMNKNKLLQMAAKKNLPVATQNKMMQVLTICETAQFTDASLPENRETVLRAAKEMITEIELHYSAYL